MKIAVTHKHIYQGQPCNAGYCPTALAIHEALYIRYGFDPTNIIVLVADKITITTPLKTVAYKRPSQMIRFTQKFDSFNTGYSFSVRPKIEELLEKVEPFIFELPGL